MIPNLLLYNFAIKVPVIIGNLGLAYFVRHLLVNLQVDEGKAQKAWLFILFNPFLLYTTSAWGQFDTLIALFTLASLYFLHAGRIRVSALLLALSISMKPVALPLIPLPFLYTAKKSPHQTLEYLLVFTSMLLLLSATPFFLMGWSLQPILSNWNAHFTGAGGITFFNIVELLEDSELLPEALQPLGYLWLPALAIGYYALRLTHPLSMEELIQKATSIIFVSFLTRTWLKEPNIDLVIPFMLILATMGKVSWRSLHLVWIIPLIFTILNASLPQLFFLIYPPALTLMAELDQQIRSVRLMARVLIVVPWQILGWRVFAKGLVRT